MLTLSGTLYYSLFMSYTEGGSAKSYFRLQEGREGQAKKRFSMTKGGRLGKRMIYNIYVMKLEQGLKKVVPLLPILTIKLYLDHFLYYKINMVFELH